MNLARKILRWFHLSTTSLNQPICAYAGQKRIAVKTKSKIYLSFGTQEALIHVPIKKIGHKVIGDISVPILEN